MVSTKNYVFDLAVGNHFGPGGLRAPPVVQAAASDQNVTE